MSYWKPSAGIKAALDRDVADTDNIIILGSSSSNSNRKNMMGASSRCVRQEVSLPISKFKNHILYALEKFTTVIIISETGSGKSTQIPQYLYHAGWTTSNNCNDCNNIYRGIACTQPRRMAVISVASRVAEEMGCLLGNEVGYSIRFDQKTSPKTVIKYCTDGILLRETLTDPLLSSYSVIIIDEVHERSLNTDILLGLLKKIKKKRKDLRVIITSATLNADKLREFFETNSSSSADDNNTACVLSVEGRQYPVDIEYLARPCHDYIKCAVDTVINIHNKEKEGDVLVFLPGAEEIDHAIHLLEEICERDDIYFLPLYSSLPISMQMKIFAHVDGKRKVIVSTNVAETSITIEGIKYVVDSGFMKLNYFDFTGSVETLVTCSISKSSASQRAGRAGRTSSGKCFRLVTEVMYQEMPDFSPPEMQRVNISAAILQLKALGIDDVAHFNYLSPPSPESMISALEVLYSLGAIDQNCKLTSTGEKMAEMPVDPRLAKSLLNSFDNGCGQEMLTIAAMCVVESPFIVIKSKAKDAQQRLLECKGEFFAQTGDHLTLLNIYNEFIQHNCDASWCDSMCLQHRILVRAREIRQYLEKMIKKYLCRGETLDSCGNDTIAIRKCIVSGYFANAAQLGNDGNYWTLKGRRVVALHPNSVYFKFGIPPEWVIFNDVVHSKIAQIRDVTKIDAHWLVETANHYYEQKR